MNEYLQTRYIISGSAFVALLISYFLFT